MTSCATPVIHVWCFYMSRMQSPMLPPISSQIEQYIYSIAVSHVRYNGHTLRKDFVILQLYWWLFSSTKHCS